MEVKPELCWKPHAVRKVREKRTGQGECILQSAELEGQDSLLLYQKQSQRSWCFLVLVQLFPPGAPISPFGNSHVYSVLGYVEALGLQYWGLNLRPT